MFKPGELPELVQLRLRLLPVDPAARSEDQKAMSLWMQREVASVEKWRAYCAEPSK